MTPTRTAPQPSGAGFVRQQFRRLAWLMLGAAIGVAAELVGVGVLALVNVQPPAWTLIPIAVVAGSALSLVPGARELEVTAARTMLGSTADLIIPDRPRPIHRLQTMAWVVLHLLSGMAVGTALFAGIPVAVLTITENATGNALGSVLAPAETDAGRTLMIIAAVIAAVLALICFWPIGTVMARAAGRFLGPTAHDRLGLAIDRANREAEHTRLARELHDGLGHALTIISVQAAAGRRIGRRDPDSAAEAFATIEDTSRSALAELDQLLAVLREDKSSPAVPVDLDGIIAAHRRAGLEIDERVLLPHRLPALLQRNVHRIVTEALTNAHRHGGPGPVQLVAEHRSGGVTIEVINPMGGRLSRRLHHRGGRGLAGIAERVALFGGSVAAGPNGERWVLQAFLPLPDSAFTDDPATDDPPGAGSPPEDNQQEPIRPLEPIREGHDD